MSPKNTILLSVTLTAFVMAILFGVITQVVNYKTQEAAVAPTIQPTDIPDTSVPTDAPTAPPTATQPAPLSYDEAASLAATAINRKDVYSVETIIYQGLESFKVVFSSGDIVYIGLNRQVLAAVQPTQIAQQPTSLPAQVIYVTQPPAKHRAKSAAGGSSSSSGSPVSSAPPGEPNDN